MGSSTGVKTLAGVEGKKLWNKTELSCLSALKACVLKKPKCFLTPQLTKYGLLCHKAGRCELWIKKTSLQCQYFMWAFVCRLFWMVFFHKGNGFSVSPGLLLSQNSKVVYIAKTFFCPQASKPASGGSSGVLDSVTFLYGQKMLELVK